MSFDEPLEFEIECRRAIEQHVTEVLGGEVYPAEFTSAFAHVAAPGNDGWGVAVAKFITFGIDGARNEGEPIDKAADDDEAKRKFLASVKVWLDLQGRRGCLYWRRPPILDRQGGVSIRARFAYLVPPDGMAFPKS